MPGVPRSRNSRVRIVRKIKRTSKPTTTTTTTSQQPRRRKRQNKSTAPFPRTTNSLEVALRTNGQNSVNTYTNNFPGYDYVHCRLDPFGSSGARGIPDGSGGRRIVQDHRMYCDLTIGTTGSIIIKTMPMLPWNAAIKLSSTDAAAKINGTTINTGSAPGTYNASWIPILAPAEWNTWVSTNPSTAAAPTEIFIPYNSTRARMITQAFRLTYSGQSSLASGIVTVQSDRFQVNPAPTINTVALNQSTWDTAAAPFSMAIGSIYEMKFDTFTVINTIRPGARTFRPEERLEILSKHGSDVYSWNPCYASPLILRDTSQLSTYFAGQNNVSYGAIAWIDPDWESVEIIISGAPTGSTFRFECVQCVEYEPSLASTLYTFAQNPPKTNKVVLEAASQAAKDAPVAHVLSDQWLKDSMRSIGKFIWDRTGLNPKNLKAGAQLVAEKLGGMTF